MIPWPLSVVLFIAMVCILRAVVIVILAALRLLFGGGER